MNALNRDPLRRARPARRRARGLALPLLAALLIPAAAMAQPRSFIALGAISVPEFEGSSDASIAPLVAGRVDLGSGGSLRILGQTVQYNMVDAPSAWAFGPMISFRPERDASVDDEVIQRLREVDATVELGGFIEYGIRDVLASGDRVGLGLEARGGKGSQMGLTVNYLSAKRGSFQFGADARLVFANDKYMETYFSVDADNSARSGLPGYTASGGAKNVAFGLTATYDLSASWLVLGRVGVSRLLGDAKDSPIVQLRGDDTAASFGVAVGYRF